MAAKDNITIKDINVYKEKRKWYMTLVAEVEDDTKVTEYRIPKISLCNDGRMAMEQGHGCFSNEAVVTLFSDFGSNVFVCHKGVDNKTGIHGEYVAEVIKEKTQELTLEEIEKRLGYKVKIVSDKK